MKIFIGNLSSEANETELKKRFGKYGEVDSVTILESLLSSEEEKGMAFVEMPDEKRALKAIKKMNGKKLFGEKLIVHMARSSSKDRRSPIRGGGRRGDDSPEKKEQKN